MSKRTRIRVPDTILIKARMAELAAERRRLKALLRVLLTHPARPATPPAPHREKGGAR